MAIKKSMKDYHLQNIQARSAEEAIAELNREADVRRRLFDRWVAEGKMSWVEAHDRMERLISAIGLLVKMEAEIDLDNELQHQ